VGRQKWEPEVSLGEAFMKLGQAVESIRSVRDTLWYLARVSTNPAHQALLESLIEAQTATNATYEQLARDPRQPYKGESAMAEYCRRRGYSDLVVQGGLEYLISSWERTVTEVETGYPGIVLEYINDLDGRRIIHEVWLLTSAEQQIRFGPRLEQADKRFEASTESVEESFSLGVRKNPDRYPPMVRWLYYRVPTNKPPDW
jgi:hypothetical protein